MDHSDIAQVRLKALGLNAPDEKRHIDTIIAMAQKAAGADVGAFFVSEGDHTRCVFEVGLGDLPEKFDPVFARRVFAQNGCAIVKDALILPEFENHILTLPPYSLRSAVGHRINDAAGPIGMFVLASRQVWSEEELQSACQTATHAAQLITDHLMHRLTVKQLESRQARLAMQDKYIAGTKVGFALATRDGQIIEQNPAMRTLMNFCPEGGTFSLFSVLDGGQSDTIRTMLREAVRTGLSGEIDLHIRSTGTVVLLSFTPQDDMSLVLIAKDVSLERASERRIAETDSMRQMLDSVAGVGHWRYDPHTNSGHWSPAMYNLYGHDPDLGLPSVEAIHVQYKPEDDLEIRRLMRVALCDGKPFSYPVQIRHTDGRTRSLLIFGMPCFDHRGRVRAVDGLTLDQTELMDALQAATHNQTLLSSFIDYTPARLAVFDKNMRFLAASRNWIEAANYGERDVIGTCYYDRFPQLPEKFRQIHARALKGEVCSSDHDYYDHPDGQRDWYRWECRPWKTPDGDIGGVIVLNQDITGIMQALNRAEQAENRVQRAIDVANLAVWELDVKKRELTTVGPFNELFDTPLSADRLARNPFVFVHPLDRADVIKTWREAVREGRKSFTVEHRVIREDETEIWVQNMCTFVYDENGQTHSILGAFLNTTESKLARLGLEEARLEAEANRKRLELALSSGHLVVWGGDMVTGEFFSEGDIDYYLPGHIGQVNLMEQAFELAHPEDREKARAGIRNAIRNRTDYEMEHRFMRSPGEYRWVLSQAFFEYDANGKAVRALGLISDIHDKKLAEIKREEALEQARHANQAKSEFLANMSHEIRTPLNGVIGIAGALARSELNDEQRDWVRLIETSGRTLEGLLSDILDIARIEAGRVSLEPVEFELPETLKAVCGLFETEAEQKGIAFELKIAPAAQKTFCADPLRLRQIVSNLVSNAVKFTDQGSVSVSAKARRIGPEENGKGRVRLTVDVTDTGPGLTEDQIGRLFNRFEQGDASTTRRHGGSGLGLAIARSLCEMMNGSLSIRSTPGEGSTFTMAVEIEGVQNDISDTTCGPVPAEPVQSGLRVLLAEDHPVNQKVVALSLQAINADLTIVDNGALAVEAARAGVFDLILMDVQMPVMDGLTATRIIRDTEIERGQPRTPIICLTANALDSDIRASQTAGADWHQAKPISPTSLLTAISYTLEKTARLGVDDQGQGACAANTAA